MAVDILTVSACSYACPRFNHRMYEDQATIIYCSADIGTDSRQLKCQILVRAVGIKVAMLCHLFSARSYICRRDRQ